jgi:hypothetical protein
MPVFTRLTTSARPGKRASASSAPSGMPASNESAVAPAETCSESQVICQTSASPASSRRNASRTPCPKSPTVHAPGG